MRNIIAALAAISLTAGGLAACGGGSVSTGAAGGGGGNRANSSLVVQVNDQRTAAVRQEQAADRSLAAVISELMVRSAIAQTAGVPIYIDGTQVAVTDETGSAVIPLTGGTYEVCVSDPTVPTNCTLVTVEPDSVVVISDVNIDDAGLVTFGPITTEAAEDNVVAFQDPNNANKTIVCHRSAVKQFTISVGTPAALNGHLGHGDSLGACPESAEGEDDDGGGPPANAGRPNNPGKGNGRPGNAGRSDNPGKGNGNGNSEDA